MTLKESINIDTLVEQLAAAKARIQMVAPVKLVALSPNLLTMMQATGPSTSTRPNRREGTIATRLLEASISMETGSRMIPKAGCGVSRHVH